MESALAAQRSAVLVVNTRSRRGHRLFGEARQLLVARGMDLAGAYAVRNPARVPEIVADAVERGHRLVIVGGGDGTISSVVGCFAYRDAVLAILPVGTANSFARAVGVPLDLEQAVEVATGGKVADVDLGQINDNYFANAAAIGLPASIARSMPASLKRWLGRAGYLLVASTRLLRHHAFRCAVKWEAGSRSFEALEVRVANGEYQGGVRVADEASVESRDLAVQYIKGQSRASIARFWWKAAMGMPGRQDDVEVVRASEFVLECLPAQYVSIDGEPVTRTPIRARVARQALLLRVGREQQDIG
jgi:YegS/Rv2252/BmrU family lipid kinase